MNVSAPADRHIAGKPSPPGQRWPFILICAAGILVNAWLACTLFVPHAWMGRNDFLGFYTGAKLAGSPHLYDRISTSTVHTQAIGETGEIQFGRLPYYAWLLKPLGLLPYKTAYLVWEALSAVAFVSFVLLWPCAQLRTRWCLACWSLPVFVAYFNGQEDLFLLLWIALAARLLQQGKPVAAGLLLALCASKFHLFTLVPLVLVAQRRWRMTAGAAAGAGVLLAASFALAGPGWPAEYWAVLIHPGINTSLEHMPNLHSLFGAGPAGVLLQIAATLALAVGVFLAARHTSSFEQALAPALAAGLLVGFHGYLHDCSLLLPGILAFIGSRVEEVRLPVLALISPIPWFFLQMVSPFPALAQLLILVFACSTILWLVRSRRDTHGVSATLPCPVRGDLCSDS